MCKTRIYGYISIGILSFDVSSKRILLFIHIQGDFSKKDEWNEY